MTRSPAVAALWVVAALAVLAGCGPDGEPQFDGVVVDASCALGGDCVVVEVTNVGTAAGAGGCVATAVASSGGMATGSVEFDVLEVDESTRIDIDLGEGFVGDVTPRCLPSAE